jgi:hypothetical protein
MISIGIPTIRPTLMMMITISLKPIFIVYSPFDNPDWNWFDINRLPKDLRYPLVAGTNPTSRVHPGILWAIIYTRETRAQFVKVYSEAASTQASLWVKQWRLY